MEWISVNDQKPKECQNVLVFGGYSGTRINIAWRCLNDDGKEIYIRLNTSDKEYPNVSHWTPLPEPPKTP